MFHIIIAVDGNFGIGLNNRLPWKSKTDIKHFYKTTKGHILIAGRKTWESMPQSKILKDRNVIVVSNTYNDAPCGVVCAASLQEALNVAYESLFKDQEVFVIGGAQLYKEAMQHADLQKIYVTYIHGTYMCDKFADFVKDYTDDCAIIDESFHDDCTICTYLHSH